MHHSSQRRRRVVLYSHDTQGLGHIRRNIAIASALVDAREDTDVLLLSGAPEATSLPLPANTEVVTLPTLHKDISGGYSPRTLGARLDDVLRLRGQIVAATVTSFEPQVFIVDKVARGVRGELDVALRTVREIGAKVVLGLRDILDSAEVTAREWTDARTVETVGEYYDRIWIYGDPTVYDVATAYGWPPAVCRKVSYTGYLAAHRPRAEPSDRPMPGAPYVLCLVGGGQDGAQLADAFVRCPLPAGHHGLLVAGPYMPAEQRSGLLAQAEYRSDMDVLGFTPHVQDYVEGAAAAVTMGGYNSVCELLAAGCPTLVIPRVRPREEQIIRARALERLGWVDTAPSREMSPGQIGDWLGHAVTRSAGPRRPIDLDGLTRIPQLVDSLLDDRVPEVAHHAAV